MSKFKVGDRVKVIDEYFTILTNGSIHFVSAVRGDGFIGVDGATSGQWREERFVLVNPTLDNLSEGDVVVDDYDHEHTVGAIVGSIILLVDPDGHAVGPYTAKELKDNDWTVKSAEPELTEVTLEQIAEKFGKPVSSIRVKE
jgi:hypothetical protein